MAKGETNPEMVGRYKVDTATTSCFRHCRRSTAAANGFGLVPPCYPGFGSGYADLGWDGAALREGCCVHFLTLYYVDV